MDYQEILNQIDSQHTFMPNSLSDSNARYSLYVELIDEIQGEKDYYDWLERIEIENEY